MTSNPRGIGGIESSTVVLADRLFCSYAGVPPSSYYTHVPYAAKLTHARVPATTGDVIMTTTWSRYYVRVLDSLDAADRHGMAYHIVSSADNTFKHDTSRLASNVSAELLFSCRRMYEINCTSCAEPHLRNECPEVD